MWFWWFIFACDLLIPIMMLRFEEMYQAVFSVLKRVDVSFLAEKDSTIHFLLDNSYKFKNPFYSTTELITGFPSLSSNTVIPPE